MKKRTKPQKQLYIMDEGYEQELEMVVRRGKELDRALKKSSDSEEANEDVQTDE